MINQHLLVANYKANLTIREMEEWLKRATPKLNYIKEVAIALCPNFINLPLTSEKLRGTNLFVGAQDVSQFRHGAYTGEITVEMLKGLVRYCIVGHSERKKYFGENNHLIAQKVKLLQEYKIKPIVCLENSREAEELSDLIKSREIVIAYEPTFAIGTGEPETPTNAQKMAVSIKHYFGEATPVIYGGSVTPDNIASFLDQKDIHGILVGGSSLNPEEFVALVHQVAGI